MCNIRERAIKRALIHVAEIKGAAPQGDGFLSTGAKPAEVRRVACRLVNTANQPRTFLLADKSVTRSPWQILFPLATEIGTGDVVEIDGQTFTIDDTDRGAAGKTLLCAFCKKTS